MDSFVARKNMAHTIIYFCLLFFVQTHIVATHTWEQVQQLQEQGDLEQAIVLAHHLHAQSSGFSFLVQEKEIQAMRQDVGMTGYQSSWYFLWAYFISWTWWLVIVLFLLAVLVYILFRYKKISTRHLVIFCVSSGMFFMGFVQKYRLSTQSQGIIIQKKCPIKGGPDETYLSVDFMEYGQVVTVKQEQGAYLFVTSGIQKGWVVKDHIKNI